ncbi:hypothetical protein LOZ65_003592 [Ophidiomyces ophidiicola]|nr:hypothetical protein LOZ65_003592 [Ophidiomyces ophidiicola]
MGYGKTLICLALILATKGHFPQIPSAYFQDSYPVREKTASLLEMAAAAAGRLSLPWKSHFDRLSTTGIHYQRCLSACERNRGSYAITQAPKYHCRNTTSSKIKSCHLQLSSGTLLIVPSNLVDHWLREIAKHTQTLRVLVLREKSNSTPPAHELLDYDIILFSKPRFEYEHGGFSSCSSELYDSPLKEIHWLRIIVDEGHNFASAGGKSNAIHLLERLHVERRWVVSGTPSDGLYGVEICLASQETNADAAAETSDRAVAILTARKDPRKSIAEELKNLDKLRRIVVDFLCLKPWANCQGNDSANWAKYMKPAGTDGKRKMARSLRPTLQSIVVRHRTEDINKDLSLPKLHNKVVYLEPTYYDKLSLNMFIFQLTVNAITSERTDQDYMFHPRNRKYLSVTINHLRQAGFWWCGSEKADVEATLNIARNYMEKNRQNMTDADLSLLWEGILIAENTISCSAWNAFSRYHEVGVLIHGFPEHAREVWSINGQCEKQGSLLLGLSQAREAQKFVTARLCAADPAEGIVGAGIKVKGDMERGRKGNIEIKSTPNSPIPSQSKTNDYLVHSPKPETPLRKRKFSNCKSLLAKSPLAKAKLVATSSAKLTYLLDRVLELQGMEKIIIFYENTNTAFWVAEGLEVLGVDFRIYASTLKAAVKSEYLSVFNNSDAVRVLLMDLRQASHGLHVASASRIFIIVPIWDPNVESQAIKRAHRISQTKPVYVETLVLQGTLEDKMLKRRKQMSSAEMQHAEKDLLEDHIMSRIIQTEGFIPISNDTRDTGCAYLKSMPGFFDRHKLPVPDAHDIKAPAPSPTLPPTKLSAARLSSSQQTPFKKEGKAAHSDIPFLNSDVSPGSEITTKRRLPFLDEVITPDGLIMTIDKRSMPRKRRAVSWLQDIADGNNDSSGGSVPRTPGLKDRKNVPEDPFYIPGDDCTAGAPFCLSIPDD